MRYFRIGLGLTIVLLGFVSPVWASDLLPADRPIAEVVDHYIDEALAKASIAPAPPADDAALIRRLTLDLTGRIPTAVEMRGYVESTDPEKRQRLVDRLMSAPGFVRHQTNELDALLTAGGKGSLRDYLAKAVGENRPWDRIFREILLPDEKDPSLKQAGEYLRQRVKDLDRLTYEVSSTFFGVNISCAQCHDHPLVKDWKQDHFFGMKAFLGRTFENGGFLAEHETGTVKFKTTAGLERVAPMMFLTGTRIKEPDKEPSKEEKKAEKERLEKAKKEKTPPPPPKESARAKLVEVALQPGERVFFARSIANRVWHRLMGRGLVMPLDQMHSANPPSHPELLDWLARDVAEHGYDLRRLIRGVVLSRAYARSSRWEGKDAPATSLFAVAAVRSLTPLQLATALRVATTDPGRFPADLAPEEFEKRLGSLESSARGLASSLGSPGDAAIGVSEALLFSNSERIARDFLGEGGDGLVGALKKINDRGRLVDTAVRNVLSRPPEEEEARVLSDYLDQRSDRPDDAIRQLVWALLTCSEFRFNH